MIVSCLVQLKQQYTNK